MATYHSFVMQRVNDIHSQIGWMPRCSCGWVAVVCGTTEAAQRMWENNHVAAFMTEEEIQAKKKEAREEIRNRVLSKFIDRV